MDMKALIQTTPPHQPLDNRQRRGDNRQSTNMKFNVCKNTFQVKIYWTHIYFSLLSYTNCLITLIHLGYPTVSIR